MMPRQHQGFTLIELLVSLAIMGIIAIAGYRGLDAVLQSRAQIAVETRKWQHLEFFFSRIELDIAQAELRPIRDSLDSTALEWSAHPVVLGANDAELSFTRAGINDQGTELQSPQRIAYRLERGNIVLLRWPAADHPHDSTPTRNTLLEGVSQFKLRYLDKSNIWQMQWPPSTAVDGLPSAVELNLTLNSGEQITRIFALQ